MPDKVAVVGTGGIGTRHLQAIVQSQRALSVFAVDPADGARDVAQRALEQVPRGRAVTVEFLNRLDALPAELDVVIVATSSLTRRQVVAELLAHSHIRYLVLEKFLFPRVDDYAAVQQLVDEQATPTWVNCPRRMNAFYGWLRDVCATETIDGFSVEGTDWGLGCNGVHLIDLLCFLTGSSKGLAFDPAGLTPGCTDSKRAGYIEFLGTLSGRADACRQITLTSGSGTPSPILIALQGPEFRCEISEGQGVAKLNRASDSEERTFSLAPQSQLSGTLVQTLLDTGTCQLTSLSESTSLHLPLLQAFLQHLNTAQETRTEICPIT